MISGQIIWMLSFFVVGCTGSSDTWVVLVAASRYWFNYRHLSNVLAVYQIVKRFGVRDSNIILMNGFDDVCGSRNPFPGQIFGDTKAHLDVCRDVQSDYTGSDVTVDAFLRLLTGRHYAGTPHSKRLNSNNESNVMIYLSGHGGDGFFKFRDAEEIASEEIASAISEMKLKQKYRRLLLISDTCQAATLDDKITAPFVASFASSGASENSYAYYPNAILGVSIIDRFSYSLSEYFRLNVKSPSDLKRQRLSDLINYMDPRFLQSTPSFAMTDGFTDPRKIKLSWFFSESKYVNISAETKAHRSMANHIDISVAESTCSGSTCPLAHYTEPEAKHDNDGEGSTIHNRVQIFLGHELISYVEYIQTLLLRIPLIIPFSAFFLYAAMVKQT